ncbi:hypothetical protein [Ktedonobacter racemifer]|uniref:hypothetical protein n=1 Tax=Ktedonobacter racemifer TaxID=363277 RepID=UPI0012FB0915|nr:hypothetical protein [Ktedonobacter racemifer]
MTLKLETRPACPPSRQQSHQKETPPRYTKYSISAPACAQLRADHPRGRDQSPPSQARRLADNVTPSSQSHLPDHKPEATSQKPDQGRSASRASTPGPFGDAQPPPRHLAAAAHYLVPASHTPARAGGDPKRSVPTQKQKY